MQNSFRNESLLTLETICEALHIEKYYPILVKNDIGLEDLFMLTERDLVNMRLSIGAKNRLLQFQQCFKGKDPRSVKNMLLCK